VLAGRSFRRALTAASAMGPDRGGDRGVTRALTGWGAALALRARMASGAFYTPVPIRPRLRGERRSLRTFPGASLRPPSLLISARDAFELQLMTPLNSTPTSLCMEQPSDAAGFDGIGAGSPGFAAEAAALAAAASEKYRAALQSPFVVDGGMSATARAAVFMDWGDALRLAAASAEASGGGGGSGGGGSESDASSSSSSLEPEECWARAAQCYDEASRLDPEGCGALGVRNRNACDAALGTRRYGGHR